MDKSLITEINKTAVIFRPRPKNFGITANEYAASQEIASDTALKILRSLVASGVLECTRMKGDKRMPVLVFYRAKKK